jgi:hypothetical protein
MAQNMLEMAQNLSKMAHKMENRHKSTGNRDTNKTSSKNHLALFLKKAYFHPRISFSNTRNSLYRVK